MYLKPPTSVRNARAQKEQGPEVGVEGWELSRCLNASFHYNKVTIEIGLNLNTRANMSSKVTLWYLIFLSLGQNEKVRIIRYHDLLPNASSPTDKFA